MNEIRFIPWFFDFRNNVTQTIRRSTNFSSDWNQRYVAYENHTWKSDPNQVYFLASTSDAYTVTLLQNITIFLVFKFLHMLLYWLKNHCIVFQITYMKIKTETKWWTFILMVVEANMVDLSFSCAVQLMMSSFFCGLNKINFTLMIFVLFTLLIYSLCFYSLMRQFAFKSYIMVLLQRNVVNK